MYSRIMLGLLVPLLAVIGVELMRPHTTAPRAPEPAHGTASLDLLEHKIPELILHHVTTEEAVRLLQSKTDVPIAVDWAALSQWKKIPVDADFHDITVGDAIAFLFSFRLSGRYHVPDADFDIVNGTLLVTGAFGIPSSIISERSYDVRDLLSDEYWATAPNSVAQQTEDDRCASLCKVLEELSGITNWTVVRYGAGNAAQHEMSGVGGCSSCAGRLWIRQTTYGHHQVESILKMLRTGRRDIVHRAPLTRRIDKLQFNSVPLGSALRTIAAKAGASIAFEWLDSDYVADRSVADLNLDLPITMSLEDVTLEQALHAALWPSDCTFNEYGGGVIVAGKYADDQSVTEVIDASALTGISHECFATGSPVRHFYEESVTNTGKSLCQAISSFLPQQDPTYVGFFGTRLIVRGTVEGRRRARQVVDCLLHPIRLTESEASVFAGKSPRRLARFECHDVTPRAALYQWLAAAGTNVIWRSPPSLPDGEPDFSLDLRDVGVEDVLRQINARTRLYYSIDDRVIYLGEADLPMTGGLSGYDITPLLANSGNWFKEDNQFDESKSLDERKMEFLAAEFPGAVCWHGRLLMLGSPDRRTFDFLRQIQTSGRIPERDNE